MSKIRKGAISDALKNVALVGGGAVVAQAGEGFLKKTLFKSVNVSPTIYAIGKVLSGAALPEIGGKKNRDILEPIGNGMIAAGAIQAAHAILPSIVPGISGLDDVLSGLEDEESYLLDEEGGLSGFENDDPTLSGLEEE